MTQRATGATGSPVVSVGLTDLWAWALQRVHRYRVTGNSMAPTLVDGQHVLVRAVATADPGSIVVVRHPFRTDIRMIKRVQSVHADGLHLTGDNPAESSDSSALGRIPWIHLIGVVTARF